MNRIRLLVLLAVIFLSSCSSYWARQLTPRAAWKDDDGKVEALTADVKRTYDAGLSHVLEVTEGYAVSKDTPDLIATAVLTKCSADVETAVIAEQRQLAHNSPDSDNLSALAEAGDRFRTKIHDAYWQASVTRSVDLRMPHPAASKSP